MYQNKIYQHLYLQLTFQYILNLLSFSLLLFYIYLLPIEATYFIQIGYLIFQWGNFDCLYFYYLLSQQQIRMFTPGQIQRSYQATIPLVRNSNHLVLDNIQINSKSKWDQPIQIPPVLYYKFNVPLPESFKQIKLYPKSLLDYIKRAYEKCKDQSQKLLMEKSLRDVVRNFENDLNQVNWETYPIPQIKQDATASKIVKNEEKVVAHPVRSRLNEIRLPSSYNIVEQQKPSKALQIAKKRMQKLQKKINRQVEQGEQQKKQKVMGFSMNPPQIKVPRFNMNSIQSFPPPPPPPPSLSSNLFQSNNSLQRFSQISSKNQSSLPSKNSSMIPTILKVEIDTKPIQKFKQKIKEKQKQRQKQKQKQRQRQKQRQKQKQKQRLKQKQRQRLKEKEKEKEKEKLKQRESNKKQSGKKQAVRENETGVSKISKKELGLLQKLKEKNENINQIARRFQDFNKLKSDNYQIDAVENSDDSLDFQQVITGKNQSIEKPYLRITGRPNPDTVRPEPVLIKALKHFLEKYKKDKNYEYLISQLRSIRQDLTVQHIKNQFTVHVYQENLQISLYEKDIPQFKHCQTTLWQLYSQGHFYTRQSRDRYVAHQMVTLIMEEKSQEMEFMMTRIPDSTLENPIIQDCLKLKRQLILGNYTGFFNFFSKQDKFVKCLLDLYIDKMMVKFLLMICRTCGEKVPIKQLCQYEAKLDEIIKTQNGVTQDGFLMLKASYDQLLKSEHLLTKKVTVLLS